MSDKTIIRTTCPRDCYDACGIAVVKRADGLVKVLGDPEHRGARAARCAANARSPTTAPGSIPRRA